MGSMSRRLSRTLIKALLKHELEAMGRFALLSVRISPFSYLRRGRTDRLGPVLRRQGHPLSESRGKAQTSHRGAHAEVRSLLLRSVLRITRVFVLGIICLPQSTLKT